MVPKGGPPPDEGLEGGNEGVGDFNDHGAKPWTEGVSGDDGQRIVFTPS